MEADWSTEIGGDAAVIDQGWPGWIDIAQDVSRITHLDEVRSFPPLGRVLESVLLADCGLLPTKCDFWTLEESVDADEYDAEAGANCTTANCFVDLMPQPLTRWTTLAAAEHWAKAAVAKLHTIPCRNARCEIVLRQAMSPDLDHCRSLSIHTGKGECGYSLKKSDAESLSRGSNVRENAGVGIGASLYMSACGSSTTQARDTLASALPLACMAICSVHTDAEGAATEGVRITMKVQSQTGE